MDAKLIIDKYDLQKLSMSWFEDKRRDIEKSLKKAVGSMWDNNRLTLEVLGNHFAFSVHQQSCAKNSIAHREWRKIDGFAFLPGETFMGNLTNLFEWNLWDVRGLTALGNGAFINDPEQPMFDNVRKHIIGLAEMYIKGNVHCSDCGTEIHKSNVAGRYFAGVYCSDCWEREWKEREARETYN
jgi:hypothetical protein